MGYFKSIYKRNWKQKIFTFRNDASEFGGSIFQSVNKSLSTGIQLAWTAGQNNTRFGIAAKYVIDSDATLNVSICV